MSEETDELAAIEKALEAARLATDTASFLIKNRSLRQDAIERGVIEDGPPQTEALHGVRLG